MAEGGATEPRRVAPGAAPEDARDAPVLTSSRDLLGRRPLRHVAAQAPNTVHGHVSWELLHGHRRRPFPARLTRPYVGLIPTSPQLPLGNRMLPPVSVPIAPQARPAATATPEPDEDTPGQYAAFHGFFGGSTSG